MTGWRIAVGSDDAGYRYKTALAEVLRSDDRVASVVDVGVGVDEHTGLAGEVARGDADGPPELPGNGRDPVVGPLRPGHATTPFIACGKHIRAA